MTLSIKHPIFELSFIDGACNVGKHTYFNKKYNKKNSMLGKPQDLYIIVEHFACLERERSI